MTMVGSRSNLYCLLALVSIVLASVSVPRAEVSVGLSIQVAPPALPVYDQPACPGDGYLWTPGYWAYGPDGYYWVPGTWVVAPHPYLLWTPGYWGWVNGFYAWHEGYWGPHVGYYGGVCYGFGYTGSGFYGGSWRGGAFCYNRAVTNVNVTIIHNTYSTKVVNRTTVNNVSYNGGAGGITARPTAAELAAAHETHIPPTAAQVQHRRVASTNRALLASVNHGRPSPTALSRNVVGHQAPGARNGSPVSAMHGHTANAPHTAGGNHSRTQHASQPHGGGDRR